MEFLSVFLLTAGFVALIMIFLGTKMLLKKGGSFPQTRIGHNKVMRSKKIYCPRTMDRMEQISKKIKIPQ
jgi:hypothetical protein